MAPLIETTLNNAKDNHQQELASSSPIILPESNNKWSIAADDGSSDYDALTVRLSHKRLVKLLLEKGSRVIIKQGNTTSPLHAAVSRMGWLSVVEKLIVLGAKVSDKNSHGDTVLHLAFLNHATDRMVNRLLDNFFNETTTKNVLENNDGLGFLHIACARSNVELVRKFIADRGVANIDRQVHLQSCSKYAGFTPLHFAVYFGRYEIVELLLGSSGGAVKNVLYVQDHNGSTPIHLALYIADQRIIDLLFAHDHCKENCIDNFGLTHFMAACAGSRSNVVEEFLSERASTATSIIVNSRVRDDLNDLSCAGYSPIHFATEFGNYDNVQVLLDHGASCFSVTTDNNSWTPGALARCSGREDIVLLLQRYSYCENVSYGGNGSASSTDYAWPC